MDLKLQKKVAMVAASSKGLGFGVAQALAREGASISIGSREKNNFEKAAEKYEQQQVQKFLPRDWIPQIQNQLVNG